MKKRVISFMMSAVLTLSGLGCYGLANVHAETDTNVERKLKIFAHYAEAEKPILDYAISKVQEKYPPSMSSFPPRRRSRAHGKGSTRALVNPGTTCLPGAPTSTWRTASERCRPSSGGCPGLRLAATPTRRASLRAWAHPCSTS